MRENKFKIIITIFKIFKSNFYFNIKFFFKFNRQDMIYHGSKNEN
jgi:hypothetical protein